jgi:DHA1 family tetracycline resistance protein-like MFS transporter
VSTAASALPQRRALTFIFITVVLDIIAFGVTVPVLPALIRSMLGGDTARAAETYGLFGTVWALMQLFCSPLLGVLSDRYGRRPVILFSLFGLGIDYVVMALAPSVGWLLVGRVLSGITGASYTTAGAYIADVTTPETRAAGFGLVGAAWGLGFVLGPALGGVFGATDPRLPFWIAAALTLLNGVYGLFVLPESLPPEKRTPTFRWSKANPLGSLALLRSHPDLLGLAAVNLLYATAHQALPSVFVLYVSFRYGWSNRTVGLMLALIGVFSAIVQGGLVRPMVKRFGEKRGLLAGLASAALGYLLYGLAPTGAWFWAGVPLGAFAGLYNPSSQGLMTRRVTANQQGQLQGANASVQGIAGLIGPGLFTYTFATFIGTDAPVALPGAPFLLACALVLGGLALGIWVTRDR